MQHPGPIQMIEAPRGRRAGKPSRYTCCICGARELARGGSHLFRCATCKSAGRRLDASVSANGGHEAKSAVSAAIASGQLAPASEYACVDCGKPAQEYEHRDYNSPLAVEPICRSCNLKRGPAVPLAGTLERMVSRGGIPYRYRASVEKLMRSMGLDAVALERFPRSLNAGHWQEILPLLRDGPNRGRRSEDR